MKKNKELIKFIKEARNRGFSDLEIKRPILEKGWPEKIVEEAFYYLTPKYKNKYQLCIFLNEEIMEDLQKRAKKNKFSVSEQIEDILRRSTINTKKKIGEEKLDDLLVGLFSRRTRGKKLKLV